MFFASIGMGRLLEIEPASVPRTWSTLASEPDRRSEVEDFVDFLRNRDEDRGLVRAAIRLSEGAFGRQRNGPRS